MTAFVTSLDEDAMKAVDEFAKSVVIPMRDKYQHENIKIYADLIETIYK